MEVGAHVLRHLVVELGNEVGTDQSAVALGAGHRRLQSEAAFAPGPAQRSMRFVPNDGLNPVFEAVVGARAGRAVAVAARLQFAWRNPSGV